VSQVAALPTFESNSEQVIHNAFALLRSSAASLSGCVDHIHLFTDSAVAQK
jgi:hypothetical protein